MQNLARPITEKNYIGLNTTDPSELMLDGYFQKVNNVYVTDNKITKVPGSSIIAPAIAAYNINGLASFERIAAGSRYIIVNIDGASNAQLYRWTGSGSFAGIGSANLTNAKPMYFSVGADYLVGMNGTEVIDYDGTTVTKNRAGTPVGYFPFWFHNYMFVARSDTYQNRLWWADLGNPITYTGANYVDINAGDSDQCMGMGALADELFYFKRNTIWSITGWSGTSFSTTTIAGQNTNARLLGYGCVAPGSIVSAGNDIFFMSFLGSSPVIRSLRKTQYATTLGGGIISEDIKGTMDSINQNSLSTVSSIYDGRYVYFGIPTGSSTYNDTVLCLDTWNIRKARTRTLYPWTTMTGKRMGHITLSTISNHANIYFSDATPTGKVFKFDPSLASDDGNAIAMDVQSRDYMLNGDRKSHYKYIYTKYQTGVSSSLQIKTRVDQSSAYTLQKTISLVSNSPGLGPTGTFTLGVSALGGAVIGKSRIDLAQMNGTMLGVQFYESSTNPITLYEYSIYGKIKGLRDD